MLIMTTVVAPLWSMWSPREISAAPKISIFKNHLFYQDRRGTSQQFTQYHTKRVRLWTRKPWQMLRFQVLEIINRYTYTFKEHPPHIHPNLLILQNNSPWNLKKSKSHLSMSCTQSRYTIPYIKSQNILWFSFYELKKWNPERISVLMNVKCSWSKTHAKLDVRRTKIKPQDFHPRLFSTT